MSDAELIKELDRRFHEEDGGTPFPSEYSPLVQALSFTTRPIPKESISNAWAEFLESTEAPDPGWPVIYGIALWYWGEGMLDHAAALFEHLHRSVRQQYTNIGEVSGYQSNYLPDMIVLFRELSDLERVRQLYGRLEELYQDGHLGFPEYVDSFLAVCEAVVSAGPGSKTTERDTLLRSASSMIYEMRERLDATRRESAALRIEAESAVRFEPAREKARARINDVRGYLLGVLCDLTREYLVDAHVWNITPFREHGPAWTPILLQKAVEFEFNEKVWVKMDLKSAPKTLQHERLSINQIRRLLQNKEDQIVNFRRAVCECTGLRFVMGPHIQKGLAIMAYHSTKARHGDRSPYRISDLDEFMGVMKDGDVVFSLLELFQAG